MNRIKKATKIKKYTEISQNIEKLLKMAINIFKTSEKICFLFYFHNFGGSWNFLANVRISPPNVNIQKQNGSLKKFGGSWNFRSNLRISGQTVVKKTGH